MHTTLQTNLLKITVTGEKLRGLINLRMKEFDRIIESGRSVLEGLNKEIAESKNNVDAMFTKQQERVARAQQGGRFLGGHMVPDESIGFGGIERAGMQISRIENNLAKLRHERAQVEWLGQQLVLDQNYDLNTSDLVCLGFMTAMYRALPPNI